RLQPSIHHFGDVTEDFFQPPSQRKQQELETQAEGSRRGGLMIAKRGKAFFRKGARVSARGVVSSALLANPWRSVVGGPALRFESPKFWCPDHYSTTAPRFRAWLGQRQFCGCRTHTELKPNLNL